MLLLPDAEVDCPYVLVVPKPNPVVLDVPKAGLPDAPNAEDAPKMDVFNVPDVFEAPNAAPVPNPKAGALDTAKAVPVLPKIEVDEEPNVGVLATAKVDVLAAPKAGGLPAPNAFWVDASKGVDDPNGLLPKVV